MKKWEVHSVDSVAALAPKLNKLGDDGYEILTVFLGPPIPPIERKSAGGQLLKPSNAKDQIVIVARKAS
jgi:hypothetical protein